MKRGNHSSFTEALTRLRREKHTAMRSAVILLGLLASGTGIALWHDRILPAEAALPARDDQTLKDNILVSSTPYSENTAKVISPRPDCPIGKVIIVTGQNGGWGTGKILQRPLYYANGNVDTASATSELSFPTGSTKAALTDNQVVRLRDGSLLALKDGAIWDNISPAPAWFNETIRLFGDRKGQRGGPLLFRSTDCGNSWKLYSTLDLATIFDGKYAYPRPEKDGNGNPYWLAAGADRTELYACPFTGNVYLTTRVVSGPYKEAPRRDTALLLYSKDNGKTWQALKEDIPAWSPIVMTSTPNGRLFLFQCEGNQPKVYFSIAPVNGKERPVMSQGYEVNYVENGLKIAHNPVNNKDVDLFLQLFHPTVSRVSADLASSKIRAAYHSVNADGMQETRVILIDVRNPRRAPVVTPVRTVRAENPRDYSVLYFSFIDPDYVDMPEGVMSNTSLAYWIEAPRTTLSNKQFAIRYQVFEGDYNTLCPNYLSVQNGQPRKWSTRQDLGDYMTGGFFWRDNTLNYLAQWVEPSGIKANIVTLPYHPPPTGNPNLNLTAVWQPGSFDEIQVYDWKYDDFRRKYDELWPQGWRLHILKNRVVSGQALYTAVWRPSTASEIQVYGWPYENFRKKYDELWPQGWRLHILSNFVLDGQVLYTAVWRPGASGEIQVYERRYEDFRKLYDELWPQGWRLHILENCVVNDQTLYTAVWRPSTSGEIQVYGWQPEDFRKKYDELWPQGWRLHLLNSYVVNGQVLYTAVWRPGTSGEIQVYGWPYEDFRKKYDELWCSGWRLKLLDVY